jgi:hypothetical protein
MDTTDLYLDFLWLLLKFTLFYFINHDFLWFEWILPEKNINKTDKNSRIRSEKWYYLVIRRIDLCCICIHSDY